MLDALPTHVKTANGWPKHAFWDGAAETAEFWHLLNTSCHCSGRGSEASLITAEGLTSVEVNEDISQHHIAQAEVQRQKDGPLQNVATFPHRDGILEDFHFSLTCLLVMVGCNNQFMLPTLSKAALNTKLGKSNGKVSSLWTGLFDDMRNKFKTLSTRIINGISSHCDRAGSAQTMVETPSMSLAAAFRVGWANHGRDILWGHMSDSFVPSKRAGKSLSKWTAGIDDPIMGGQPPTFDDIGGHSGTIPSDLQDRVTTVLTDGNSKELKMFTSVLFEADANNHWHPKVRELLVMALLLQHEQFCDVPRKHPDAWIPDALERCNPITHNSNRSHDCTTIRDHLFVCRVERALEKAGVDKSMFANWTSCAHSAFLERNVTAIPIQKFSSCSCGGDNNRILLDPRSVAGHFNTLASTTQSTHVIVQQQRQQLNDLMEMIRRERSLNTQNCFKACDVVSSIRRIENHLPGKLHPESPQSKPPSNVIKFSVSSKGLTNQMPVADVFVSFFDKDGRTGFELDKKSDSLKEDMDALETKHCKNKFANIKRSVRFVLMHSCSYPLSPKAEDRSHCKQTL